MTIQDSGERREFQSGAVRDISSGKGRCDLLPLDTISMLYSTKGDECLSNIFSLIHNYIYTGKVIYIQSAINVYLSYHDISLASACLAVSHHYEEGATKYDERNWEKGIPIHCYIDSGVRHLLKNDRRDTDEKHAVAFMWNMLGLIWTHFHHPELIDIPGAEHNE